ncbi:galectin-4-like [Esox lucius]|uniref:Galectin n=1 Tax=Esox lucius TaxID=8010 RepID=A0A3P8Z0M8_ESOLU|nr:galectin-4-like [Esox lucius]
MFVSPAGYQPVYNPSVPYVGPIYGGLRSGMSVYIQGVIPLEASSFLLNLQGGEAEGSDIGFHFSPHLDDSCVVLNNCQGGEWGSEEKIESLPFSKENAFEIIITIIQEGYQVKVNGQDFHTFLHRLPVETVNALQIGGDVSIQTISFLGGAVSAGDEGENLPALSGNAVFYPAAPYAHNFPGGLTPQKTFIIRGLVPPGAYRFTVNLLVGSTQNIAFHLNPRIQEGAVVRNSLMEENWGQEERDVNFNPFQEGQYVDFVIRCEAEMFKVFVNGQHMCDYAHRYSTLSEIDTLEVAGDIQISYVSA